MQQMVDNVKQLQSKVQRRRDDALERDHIWKDLAFRAEKDVFHRLLSRIRQSNQGQQADIGVQSTITRYTRIRRPVYMLVRNPDPPLHASEKELMADKLDETAAKSPKSKAALPSSKKGAKSPTSDKKKNTGDPGDGKEGEAEETKERWNTSLNLFSVSSHMSRTDPWHPLNPEPLGHVNDAVLYTTPAHDDEIEKCERLIGKWYVELRKLFRDSCLYSKAQVVRKPCADIQMTHLQFAQLIRRSSIPSKHCTMTTIETMWSQKIAEKKKLWDEFNSNFISEDQFQTVIEFDDFLELLLRIAHSKYRSTAQLSQRLLALFHKQLFVPKTKKLDDPHEFRQQIAASSAEFIFERHDKWLHNIFLAYSEVMNAQDAQSQFITLTRFKEFVADTGMIEKGQIGVKSVRGIFINVHVEDMDADRLDTTVDNFGADFKMVYWEFLESIAALSCFVCKSPYLPLESKIDDFVNIIMTSATIDKKRHIYNMFFKIGRKITGE
jgi:hypothetical protein